MIKRKNRILLLPIVFLLTIVLVGLNLFKSKNQSPSSVTKSTTSLQKADVQNQVDIYNLSDIPDELIIEDVNKTQFAVEVLIEKWIADLFNIQHFSSSPIIAHNFSFITLPRYILYHSLQISGC
ncbi:hypothetical protein [Chryseobacterium sp. ERMR1:04]|uniref:hypothetical protein n=1 Tax=Chryseobacterium sp. ERMR1:04 TaxID=1705393 RepID=UPI0006C87009|nr:hypothetical protein [Chryseobacterium sp. ERMR1:04]KPH14014.1 hypothetical protein AMQ68_00330 [Chryseobacterium sp. ERMR1:04]